MVERPRGVRRFTAAYHHGRACAHAGSSRRTAESRRKPAPRRGADLARAFRTVVKCRPFHGRSGFGAPSAAHPGQLCQRALARGMVGGGGSRFLLARSHEHRRRRANAGGRAARRYVLCVHAGHRAFPVFHRACGGAAARDRHMALDVRRPAERIRSNAARLSVSVSASVLR